MPNFLNSKHLIYNQDRYQAVYGRLAVSMGSCILSFAQEFFCNIIVAKF